MALEFKKISFNQEEGRDFITTLRKRVNLFFKESNLSPKANFFMYVKSIFFMSIMIALYLVLISGAVGGWGIVPMYVLLGFCVAIGAMNIVHDALHGAYAAHSPGNRLLGLLMDLFGASSFYWKKEHTIDHHTYTNIAEYDADLNVPIVLRLCPKAPYRSFHRFQHLYAPLLYSLNLIHWVYFSDFKRLLKIFKNKHTEPVIPSSLEVVLLIFFKCLHFFLFVVTPILYLPFSWWLIVGGYLCFLSTMGITLTVIFQLAHIVENVAFPLPDEEGKIDNSFAIHQLSTTSNFATHNKFVNFIFGGLNFQIEHHIFPHICHMHLSKIAPILKATAKEFGLPYYENPSFFQAVLSHFRLLKKLGQPPLTSEAGMTETHSEPEPTT